MRLGASLGRNENDAAGVALEHLREVMTRQADAAEQVDFEVAQPLVVSDVNKGLRLVNAQVVDEDVG